MKRKAGPSRKREHRYKEGRDRVCRTAEGRWPALWEGVTRRPADESRW